MDDVKLFQGDDGQWVTQHQIVETLKNLGAADCDLLVVQTGVMFGSPNSGLKRREYMAGLYEALQALRVDTMAVPVFTFSFCNGEIFDVNSSRTSMGALAEYIRTRPEAKRSLDPLLSMVVIGKDDDMFDGDLGSNSFGPNSAYDRIHHCRKKVKFLCYGSEFSEYFTYVHYIEKQLDVPYRFDVTFSGKMIDHLGRVHQDTHSIHTVCGGVKPSAFPYFRDWLVGKDRMKIARLGNAEIACISEEDVYHGAVSKLRDNIHYFLVQPFTQMDLIYEYQYGKDGERVTHC